MFVCRRLAIAFSLAFVLGSPLAFHGISAQSPGPAATRQKIILDTDIGDDIDDAFALGLALSSPELQLLGVTSAWGDTDRPGVCSQAPARDGSKHRSEAAHFEPQGPHKL